MTKVSHPRPRIAAKHREYFTDNLAVLVKASVPIGDAVDSLVESAPSRPAKKALSWLREDLNEGYSLSQALRRSRLVNDQTLSLIEIGEKSGNLDTNLGIAADQEQKQRYFRSKLMSAMIYPAFVLGMTVLVALGIGWLLLPKLSDTFKSLNVELPLITRVMLEIGEFLRANGTWAVPSILAAIFLVILVLFVFPLTKTIGLRLLSHTPGIGRLLRELELARFGYLMSLMVEAGMPVTKAISLVRKASLLPGYKKFYVQMEDNLDHGLSFKDSFQATKKSQRRFPLSVQQIIVGGEKSGSLTRSLRFIGDIYEKKIENTTANFEAVIEPLMLVIVWVGVMLVALAVIVPVYSLVGGLGG